MKRRRKSSVFSERTSSDSMKKDEETSEHEDELEDQTLSFQSTDIFSPMERRRDESSDLGEPSSDQASHQSEAAEGLSDVLIRETESDPVPFQVLGSETEEITETSEGILNLSDTESVWSFSSLHGGGDSSLYFSSDLFESGTDLSSSLLHQLPSSPIYPSSFLLPDPLLGGLQPEPTVTSSAETTREEETRFHDLHPLSKEHEADAEQTLQGEEQPNVFDLSLTSLKRLNFSLPHQDESQSQYVGPSRIFRKMPEVLNIPSEHCYLSPSPNVSPVRPPELPDIIQSMGEQYGRQNSAGNNQDEIMESVGHVSYSVPNRSASTDLLQISKHNKRTIIRKRDISDSPTEMEERHQEHQNKSLHQGEESSFTNVPLQASLSLFTIAQHISESLSQGYYCSSTSRKESVESGIKMETLTENPAADEDQLEILEDLEQVISPNILTPLPLQQPLTTDSSKEEPISCSMDHNVPPSSDPTQSHSVPNRSASTDLLLPSGSGLRRGDLSNSSSSLLCPLTHQDPPLDVSILPRAASLPNMKLQSSFEEFTPGFCGDADDETYWFQCSSPGLYQCRVSGLVFDMKGGGDVFYRVVPWNRRLLSQHGKKPAGPLFDISCQQQSVAQLHLPHCEVRSTGRCHFLSVAHLRDESVEFIRPERITETHIIISITGFSAFGNVKDEDSPPDPVRALVLLFYKPPDDPGVTSFLNLLLLPGNVVIRDLKRTRKKLFGPETFIDAPPNCKLCVKETYSLSTSPAGESVLVQPAEAEFDPESYNNYFTSIQVILNSIMGDMKLSVKQTKTSCCVWERRVCLVAHRVKPGLPSDQQLKETRTRIIDGISEPVLQSLLDKLLEKKVLSDSEREAVEAEKIRGDKARVLVDTVRRKGAAASSEMIRFLCELDPFLCKHVGLICEELEPNQ